VYDFSHGIKISLNIMITTNHFDVAAKEENNDNKKN
jgi:hypothetical protein